MKNCKQSFSSVAPRILDFRNEPAVTKIQAFLIDNGHTEVGNKNQKPDGMFGKKTGNALEEFLVNTQLEHGLETSGKYDEQTRQKLIERLDDLDEGSIERNLLSGLIEGLDELQEQRVYDPKQSTNFSALDRLYNPTPKVCFADEIDGIIPDSANNQASAGPSDEPREPTMGERVQDGIRNLFRRPSP